MYRFGTSALADVPIGVIVLSRNPSMFDSVSCRFPLLSSIFLGICKLSIDISKYFAFLQPLLIRSHTSSTISVLSAFDRHRPTHARVILGRPPGAYHRDKRLCGFAPD